MTVPSMPPTPPITDDDVATIIDLVRQLPSPEFIAEVRGALPWVDAKRTDTQIAATGRGSTVAPALTTLNTQLDDTGEQLGLTVAAIDSWWRQAGVSPSATDRLVCAWPAQDGIGHALGGDLASEGGYRRGAQAIGSRLYRDGPVTPTLLGVLARYASDSAAVDAHRSLERASASSAAAFGVAIAVAKSLGHPVPYRALPSVSSPRPGGAAVDHRSVGQPQQSTPRTAATHPTRRPR